MKKDTRFKAGNRANPLGRPRKVLTAEELLDQQIRKDLKAVAKEHSPEAFRFLLKVMRDSSIGPQHRLDAAKNILDRGWGKPVNQTEISVSVYDKLSDEQLIKFITTGQVIEGEIIDEEE